MTGGDVWDRPVVLTTDLKGLGPKRQGKVRDIYDLGEFLLLIATDRISAFDVVLPEGIPGKGYVLTQMSRFWVEQLCGKGGPFSHHLVSTAVEDFPEVCHPYREVLEGRSMLVHTARPLPVECIVRGYLAGSGWKEYQEKGRVSGQVLPSGLVESTELPEPIFTPSTKAREGHDENIAFGQMRALVGDHLATLVREQSISLYKAAASFAVKRGIIIADTKFEFGIDEKGNLLLIDEILTPDSSRFWPMDGYTPGKSQPSFDKQYVRDYLDSVSWDRRPPAPHLPAEVIRQTSQKYFEALSRLTGQHIQRETISQSA